MRRLPSGQFFGSVQARRQFGSLRVIETIYASGTRLPEHSHETPYLCAVVRGAYTERMGRETLDCRAGSLVLNTCGARHDDAFLEHGTRVLNIELDQRWIELLRGSRIEHVHATGLLDDIERLSTEVRSDDPLAPLSMESLAAQLTAVAARVARCPDLGDAMDRVVERLHETAKAPMLGELEELSGIRAVKLAREFRRRFGCSIGSFVRRVRLQKAVDAIRRGKSSLAEVAQECGFADQSHMTRCVRRATGLTPARLREDSERS